MKIITLLFFLFISSDVKSQDFLKYVSKNDSTRNAVDFSINYPKNWEKVFKDGDISFSDGGRVTLMIIIKDADEVGATEDELEAERVRMITKSYVKSLKGKNTFISGNSNVLISGIYASRLIFDSELDAVKSIVYSRNAMYFLAYEGNLVAINIVVMGLKKGDIKKEFEKNKNLLDDMVSSFRIVKD